MFYHFYIYIFLKNINTLLHLINIRKKNLT